MRTPEIKICGLARHVDVLLAQELGADYVGFVLAAASPRCVTPAMLPELTCGCTIRKVGVFVNANIEFIESCIDYIDIVQLHGDETPNFAEQVARRTGRKVWRAATISCEEDRKALASYPADRFVIDYQHGGSGITCDWRWAAKTARRYPVMLAGGIGPDNIINAIKQVTPKGLDISSKIETAPGIKSEKLMRKIFEELSL